MRLRDTADRFLAIAIETIVLVIVVLSPWLLGAVEPLFEFFLYVGVAVLGGLWGGRMLCQGRFTWKKCPVALCLAALFLLGVGQLQPLPRPILSFLSPGAVRLYEELLPAEPEVLPQGETYQRPALAAGNRLSLYPGATRKELIRLLAVILLFAVVRNNIAGPDSLRRLFVVLVVNGCALAFFALVQFFTSPHNTVYWVRQTKGAVFGPFISRTHYPFYLNVCIGAGVGLLLALAVRKKEQTWADVPEGDWREPARLWLGCALALMASSVALSMSRGGFLALAAGAGMLFWLCRARFGRFVWFGTGLLTAAAALALVVWLGGKRVEDRLGTIWKGEAMEQSRLPLWRDSWPLVLNFPFVGTGLGTFAYAEPLHREHTSSIFVHEHAHNEYLEALVEGGVVRLVISLAAIGVMFHLGFRAIRLWKGKPAGALALGAVFGFTTLVVHSLGDFGLHLPAIAFLATVLCAQLAGLGSMGPPNKLSTAPEEENGFGEDAYVLRAGGLAPAAGALTLVVLALVLGIEGWRMARVQAYRLAAANLQGKTDPVDQARQMALREAAAQLAPESGRILTELAQTHLERFEEDQARLTRGREAAVAAQFVASGAASSLGPLPGGWGQPSAGLAAAAWNAGTADEQNRLAKKQLVPALRAFLQARDVCPLMAQPHFRLAANQPYLEKADARTAYIDRAKRLTTNDAEHWFFFGVQELLDGHTERAARSWRRSLEISDQFLPRIEQWGRAGLSPPVLAEEVLPNRPELLVAVAERLYPGANESAQRRPFLERALAQLAAAPGLPKPADLFLRAHALALLDQPEAAVAAYRQALQQDPRRADGHLELAMLLRAQGQLPEARQELLRALVLQPGDRRANELLAAVDREMNQR